MTSHNPSDAREGYCANCHDWTGSMVTGLCALARHYLTGYEREFAQAVADGNAEAADAAITGASLIAAGLARQEKTGP
jgi:hypothetical protein